MESKAFKRAIFLSYMKFKNVTTLVLKNPMLQNYSLVTAYFVALLTSLLVHSLSFAEEGKESLETIVVVGSLSGSSVEELTNSTTVLTTQDIQRLNKSNVMDLLRTIPSIGFSQQGGAGGPMDISIRGGESNYTLVLIDGIQVNDATNSRGGSYNFNQLSVDEIERVEVIRGPQSAIYGSDALSGVINIITHKNQEGTHHFVSLSGGQDNYGSGVYSMSHQNSAIDASIKLSSQNSGEAVEGSESNRESVNASVKFYANDRVSVTTQFRGTQIDSSSFPEQSGGPLFAVLRDTDETDAEEKGAKILLSAQVSQGVSLDLSSDYFDKDGTSTSPGVSDFFATQLFPFQQALDYKKNTHKLLVHFDTTKEFKISMGAEFKDEQGSNDTDYDFANLGFDSGSTNVSRFNLQRDNQAIFTEGTYIGKNKNNTHWLIKVGARRDEFETIQRSFSDIPLPPTFVSAGTSTSKQEGGHNSFHLGTKYFVNDYVLFANYGEAFKLPSFFALSEGNVGNPNLKTEFSKSYDTGIEWHMSDTQHFIWSYFNNRFENIISFDQVIVNVPGEVEIEGSEVMYDWAVSEELRFSFNTTYSHIKGQKNSGAITFDARPQWLANLITQWEFRPQWQGSLAIRWSDEQYSSSKIFAEAQILEANTVADLSVSYDSKQYGIYQVNIDNLADEEYQEAIGFPGIGRNVRAKWSYTF